MKLCICLVSINQHLVCHSVQNLFHCYDRKRYVWVNVLNASLEQRNSSAKNCYETESKLIWLVRDITYIIPWSDYNRALGVCRGSSLRYPMQQRSLVNMPFVWKLNNLFLRQTHVNLSSLHVIDDKQFCDPAIFLSATDTFSYNDICYRFMAVFISAVLFPIT